MRSVRSTPRLFPHAASPSLDFATINPSTLLLLVAPPGGVPGGDVEDALALARIAPTAATPGACPDTYFLTFADGDEARRACNVLTALPLAGKVYAAHTL